MVSLETANKAWSDLFVANDLIRSLIDQKFFEPTPIQKLTLPVAIRDRLDVIGAAETVSDDVFTQSSMNIFMVLGQW